MINLPPAHAPARSVWAGRAAAMSEPLATGEHGAVSLRKARTGLRAVLSRVTLPALLSTLGPRRLAVLRGDCATVEAALRPFGARPHWGKLCTLDRDQLAAWCAPAPSAKSILRSESKQMHRSRKSFHHDSALCIVHSPSTENLHLKV